MHHPFEETRAEDGGERHPIHHPIRMNPCAAGAEHFGGLGGFLASDIPATR